MDEKNLQTEANKKWQEKNREKARYLRDRSTSRSFIKNRATEEDLQELQELIKERMIYFRKPKKELEKTGEALSEQKEELLKFAEEKNLNIVGKIKEITKE